MKRIGNKLFFKGSLPIFILAGVVLFAALVLEIVRLTLFAETGTHITKEKIEQARAVPASENVFDNIHKSYPTYEEALESLKKYDVKFASHNYVKGNHRAKVKVVLFNDLDCQICRQEQARVLRKLEPYIADTLIIFKHMPEARDKESLSAMFGQIAVREGLYEKFLGEISQKRQKLEKPEDYFNVLNNIGMSLVDLRNIMKYSMTDVLKEVQDDLDMAIKAGAYNARTQPVIYINGYRLGANYLPEHRLTTYMERLIAGDAIIPNEGFIEE